MQSWGLVDADQGHEAGHMLGNKEEYFTVDGVDYGPGRQTGGNIMNNPDNPPVANHYWLIQTTVDALLGINYSLASGSTRSVNVPCSYIESSRSRRAARFRCERRTRLPRVSSSTPAPNL